MKKYLRSLGLISIIVVALAGFSFQICLAEEYPTRPIVLVNPGGPGGSHDMTARAVTSVAADYLGQPIVVKIMWGGGGAIGTEYVAKQPADGYTLLWGGPGWCTTLPAVEGRSKGPDDLEAIFQANYGNGWLLVRPDAPYKTFPAMIKWAKENPGEVVFGTTGPWGGADLAWKQIRRQAGIETKVVPHHGGGGAILALLGGHIDMTICPGTPSWPHVQSGKMGVLAVIDDQRDHLLPDVPTLKEVGYDAWYRMWRAALAPKGTPRDRIDTLAAAFKKMCEDKSVVSMIKKFGDVINYMGPDEFTEYWKKEYKQHQELGRIFKK
jgi:tripartite-type tricarboxylate transporter receptor subunit TctC